MFEKASRLKIRFVTTKGDLSVEDLWDLPLTSERGVSLDGIARALNKKLKSTDDVSFVVNVAKVDELAQLQFDIAKHIIDVRVAEAKALSDKRAKKEKKDALLALIAEKEGDAMKGLPLEDLRKQLAELE